MIFNKIFLLFVLFFGLCLNAQVTIERVKPISEYPPELLKTDQFGNKYYYDASQKARIYEIDGENVVVMDELILRNKPKFNNQLDQNYYFFLNKKLNRVYPLFLTALEQYEDIQAELNQMDKSSQKKYVSERQKKLADEYEMQLRDLTTTEGRVFAKLMNRATGKTVYDIIRELRGGWSAFWWNVKGNIADVSIKQPYDPHTDRSDEFIESLLQHNWNSGYLQPYPGYLSFKVKK
ncbi:DUF4294 domain-containing protein [Kaistella daneshvariae]|jgi:hypothetical protein|uniref:DUF4294 domain-containing protein n=1 Tax=Kaistella daneshvariae TaxID=2487074 RepID=A0A3N0WZK3_9FLAO|nr:DUF4294 domain-containing protein [Kaistella daneshvariae]AZI67997.1 DUF4294 domain-containing protein [Kaistella daneshvariae]ROI10574.1 DUF4294 domain-containing protein [Kaistella daneshvariae]